MSTRNDLGIGKLITSYQFRDAIHVAITPVKANERLNPGQHVGIIKIEKDEYFVGHSKTNVGIIDPYLESQVNKNQKCWLFLYPNTVTSLRHEWTHPAFKPLSENETVQNSINWLTKFADEVEMSYSELIKGLDNYLKYGQEICLGIATPDCCYSDRSEMWRHYEIVTGKLVSEDNKEGYIFRCAC